VFALAWLIFAQPVLVHEVLYDRAGGEDRATALGLAPDGTAFLTGYSFAETTDFDAVTIAVDTAGRIVWTGRYGSSLHSEDRAWAMAVDSSGNPTVVGGSIADFEQGWDFIALRYQPGGEVGWLRRYDSPAHSDDKPTAVAVLPDGRMVLAGSSKNRPGADSTHGVGRTDWDAFVVWTDSLGETLMTRRFDIERKDDYGTELAVDDSGNYYVCGKGVYGKSGNSAFLVRYDRQGKALWQQLLPAKGAGSMAQGVLVAAAQRLFVFGSAYQSGRSFDYLAAGFGPDGRRLWQWTMDGARGVDIAQAAVSGADSGLVITGQSTGRGTSFDVLTIRLSTDGETLWTRRYSGAQGREDRGWCVERVPGGYVVGATSVGPTGQPDLLLIGYSDVGSELWTWRYSGGGAGETRPVAMKWDQRRGRLLVAGYTNRPETGFDYMLLQIKVPGF
jgi:hypothetical protein